MIQELEDVILVSDLPQNGLQRGDIGTVVLVHRGGKGYVYHLGWGDGCRCHAVGFSGASGPQARDRPCARSGMFDILRGEYSFTLFFLLLTWPAYQSIFISRTSILITQLFTVSLNIFTHFILPLENQILFAMNKFGATFYESLGYCPKALELCLPRATRRRHGAQAGGMSYLHTAVRRQVATIRQSPTRAALSVSFQCFRFSSVRECAIMRSSEVSYG